MLRSYQKINRRKTRVINVCSVLVGGNNPISVQTMTKFDNYDPLGMIPKDQTLDWDTPDCSIDCKLDLYQLE